MKIQVNSLDITVGERGNPFNDPVSRAMRRRMPWFRNIRVGISYIEMFIFGVELPPLIFETPEIVKKFVKDYDHGEDVEPFEFEVPDKFDYSNK